MLRRAAGQGAGANPDLAITMCVGPDREVRSMSTESGPPRLAGPHVRFRFGLSDVWRCGRR